MKKLFALTLALVLALSLAACEGGKITLKEDARNELKVGDTATIVAYETPSTGFRWHCTIPEGGIVELVSDTFHKKNPFNNKPGGDAGTRYFTIKALHPGEAVIEMECRRGDDVVETRSYQIVVSGNSDPIGITLAQDARNELKAGDTATIIVYEHPSTGYLWYCEIPKDGIVGLVSDTFRQDDPGNEMPGGDAGTRYYTIKALRPGEAVIEMECRRGDDVEETRSYQIVVSAGQAQPGGTIDPKLVGTWYKGSVVGSFFDPVTGKYEGASGGGTSYTFKDDGTYSTLSVVALARPAALSYSQGRYDASNGQLTLYKEIYQTSGDGGDTWRNLEPGQVTYPYRVEVIEYDDGSGYTKLFISDTSNELDYTLEGSSH